MKKTIMAAAIIFMAAFPVFAKTENSGIPSEKAGIPKLTVSPENLNTELHDLKINVEITGNIVFTTYDMVFYNPNKIVLDGEFVMPLSENQSLFAAALDIEGKMRDGVIVETQKEKPELETVTGNDYKSLPDEKTSEDSFKMKLYPFAPESVRRVKITLEEPLEIKDKSYVYRLPLNFGTQADFDLNIEIPSAIVEGKPFIETDLQDFEFKKGNNVLKAGFSQKKYMLKGGLTLILPRQKEAQVFTHKEGKETYFYCDMMIKSSLKDRIAPKTAAIVWDSSLSYGKRDINREMALLEAYFKKFPEIEIEFMTFNIAASAVKNYTVKKGNWEELKKDISRIISDGATRFDKLNLKNLKAGEILLFTDGVSTLGDTRLTVDGSTPVFTVNSSREFNSGALENAAVKSNGCFINLNVLTDKEAAELLTKQSLKLISYSFEKDKIKALYPQKGTRVEKNFVIAGILTSSESEIALSFGYNKNDIASTKKIKIRASGDNPAVERLWAAQKIKTLETDGVKNKKEIVKLGQKYSIITSYTSLAVLENAADYALYGIIPPKELKAQYDTIISAAEEEKKYKKRAALEDAVLQVQDIKDWWKKDYSQPKPVKALTAFGVKQEELFENVPAATEGEVKAPSQQSKLTETFLKGGGAAFSGIVSVPAARAKKETAAQPSAQIKAWDPQVPYMKIIRNSFDEEIYSDYLKLKAGYGDQPSFYFDIADELIRRKMPDKAVVVLSNIVEMQLDNAELLRVAAYKLTEAKSYSYAVDVFEKIVKLRGDDPQSYRELALACQDNKEYKKALEVFYKILTRNWERFQSIKQVVFVEMNNLISLRPDINLAGIDKRLIFPMPVDIRIVLGWSTDETDIDIYVKEPNGEDAYYGNRFTSIGGKVSEDLTQGFGPEEYMIRKAPDGQYLVRTDYFADERQSISGPTVLYLDIYTFYGTKKQTHKRSIIRTENVKENDIIGTLDFKKPEPKKTEPKKAVPAKKK